MLKRKKSVSGAGRYGTSADMWSLGVVLYILLSGSFPFLDDENLFDHIEHAHYNVTGQEWAGISPAAYRAAIMNLDAKALKGPEVKAAFVQLRKLSDWMDPNVAAQPYASNLAKFVAGDMGMMIQGGWAQGVLLNAGFKLDDFIIAPGPSDNGKPVFILNADAFIFWQRKEADLQAGQKLMAELVMDPAIQTMYSQITGSIPVRTDVDLGGPGWSDGQREAARTLKDSLAANQVVLSLAHNMAQENGMTAAMIDVLTEYVKNRTITPDQAITRLSEAVESSR